MNYSYIKDINHLSYLLQICFQVLVFIVCFLILLMVIFLHTEVLNLCVIYYIDFFFVIYCSRVYNHSPFFLSGIYYIYPFKSLPVVHLEFILVDDIHKDHFFPNKIVNQLFWHHFLDDPSFLY